MGRQHCLDVFDLPGGDVALEHRKDSARRVLRVDRVDVVQSGRDGRKEFLLVTQSFGFSGRVMLLIIIEAAHQDRQLGAELGYLVDREPVAQSVQHSR
jgi:hypothetical protein